MKKRFCAALLLAAFCVTLFTGCAAANTPNHTGPDSRMLTTPASAPATISTRPATTEVRQLTKDDAVSIALRHANLTEDQVTRLRVAFGYDDGRPEYEVDFHYNGYAYDYEIHAETGTIITWDKDRES